MVIVETLWDPDSSLLVSRLGGAPGVDDVQQWQTGLERELGRIPDGAAFKALIDLSGYEPGDLAAHKQMRVVVPLMLAAYGFRTALLDLFDSVDLPIRTTRGITCVAVAHVHHDAGKMDEYDRRLGRANERFFTDAGEAERWLRTAAGS